MARPHRARRAIAVLLLGAAAAAACAAAPASKRMARLKLPAAGVALPLIVLPLQRELLTSGQLDAASRVFVGSAACRGDVAVQLQPLLQNPGHFELRFGQRTWLLAPQQTASGAVRLEDRGAGIVWLQIPAKSMLLDARAGERLADECRHAEQLAHVAASGDALGIEALAAAPP